MTGQLLSVLYMIGGTPASSPSFSAV